MDPYLYTRPVTCRSMGKVWGVGVQSGGWGSRFEIKPTWMKAVMNDVVVIVTEVVEDMRVMRVMLTMTMGSGGEDSDGGRYDKYDI